MFAIARSVFFLALFRSNSEESETNWNISLIKAQISVDPYFVSGPRDRRKTSFIKDPHLKKLFSIFQCNPSTPICPTKDFLFYDSG